MKQTQHTELDEMIEQIVLSSPPSVLIKVRVNNRYDAFVNVDHIPSDSVVIEPRQYKIYFSPNNTELKSF
jgi:hypothetical protein